MENIKSIVDELKEPRIIAKPTGKDRSIMYVYADAFTTCDCGKDMKLTVLKYGSDIYEGGCECGKKYTLFCNKLYDAK